MIISLKIIFSLLVAIYVVIRFLRGDGSHAWSLNPSNNTEFSKISNNFELVEEVDILYSNHPEIKLVWAVWRSGDLNLKKVPLSASVVHWGAKHWGHFASSRKRTKIVSFAAVFWMSRNAPGGSVAWHPKRAAKETGTKTAVKCSKMKKRSSQVCNSAIFYNEICK